MKIPIPLTCIYQIDLYYHYDYFCLNGLSLLEEALKSISTYPLFILNNIESHLKLNLFIYLFIATQIIV